MRCATSRSVSQLPGSGAATNSRSSREPAAALFRAAAAQSLGGTRCRSTRNAIATELVFVLDHAEISVIVAEEPGAGRQNLSLREQLPH